MNEQVLLDIIGTIDPNYISEAYEMKPKKGMRLVLLTVAVAVAFVVCAAIFGLKFFDEITEIYRERPSLKKDLKNVAKTKTDVMSELSNRIHALSRTEYILFGDRPYMKTFEYKGEERDEILSHAKETIGVAEILLLSGVNGKLNEEETHSGIIVSLCSLDGYDPGFRIAAIVKSDEDSTRDEKLFLFEHIEYDMIVNGKCLFSDLLRFREHLNPDASVFFLRGEDEKLTEVQLNYETTEILMSALENGELCKDEAITANAGTKDGEKGRLLFQMQDGTDILLVLLGDGYISYWPCTECAIKIPLDVYESLTKTLYQS